MATWDDVRSMAGTDTGLCVVSMVRADGSLLQPVPYRRSLSPHAMA